MQVNNKANMYYFVFNFTDSLESNYEAHKQSQTMVSDLIQETNSIVEKVDLTQAQMNGKISNYLCLSRTSAFALLHRLTNIKASEIYHFH